MEETVKTAAEIQAEAVDTLMEEGYDFTVTVAIPKWYHRWLGWLSWIPIMYWAKSERKFMIYPINMGSLFKISQELLKLIEIQDFDGEKSFNDVCAHKVVEQQSTMVKIVVYAIQNSDEDPSLKLIKYLTNNLNSKELLQLITVVLHQMDFKNFFSSTVLATGMNLMRKMEKKAQKVKNLTNGKESESSSNTIASAGKKSSGKGATKT